jgi:hypothetical protein
MTMINQPTHFEPAGAALHDERRRGLAEGEHGPDQMLQYIEEIARSITSRLDELAFEPEIIIASFHGMPADTVNKGDPYFVHCRRTGELIRMRLGEVRRHVPVALWIGRVVEALYR